MGIGITLRGSELLHEDQNNKMRIENYIMRIIDVGKSEPYFETKWDLKTNFNDHFLPVFHKFFQLVCQKRGISLIFHFISSCSCLNLSKPFFYDFCLSIMTLEIECISRPNLGMSADVPDVPSPTSMMRI